MLPTVLAAALRALRLLVRGSLLRTNADAAAVIEQAVLFFLFERGRSCWYWWRPQC